MSGKRLCNALRLALQILSVRGTLSLWVVEKLCLMAVGGTLLDPVENSYLQRAGLGRLELERNRGLRVPWSEKLGAMGIIH